MLAGISGTVREIGENHLQIDTGPFCFRVFCPFPTLQNLHPGSDIRLFTHLHVREDELSLFGFLSGTEVQLFRHLISVSGIGPKMALEILAAGEPAVSDAIISENIIFLTSIKGIGKKTAERTVLELRGKIEQMVPSGNNLAENQKPGGRIDDQVIATLEGLGWKKSEILKQLSGAPKELSDAEEIVKWFLTHS